MNEAGLIWADMSNLPARVCVKANLAESSWLVEVMEPAAISISDIHPPHYLDKK